MTRAQQELCYEAGVSAEDRQRLTSRNAGRGSPDDGLEVAELNEQARRKEHQLIQWARAINAHEDALSGVLSTGRHHRLRLFCDNDGDGIGVI
jgi:hypothetical protein